MTMLQPIGTAPCGRRPIDRRNLEQPHASEAALAASAPPVDATTAKRRETRAQLCDRLGLPRDAGNDTILATLDTKLAAKKATTRQQSHPQPHVNAPEAALDALYELAFGDAVATTSPLRAPAPTALSAADQALMKSAGW